jgi:hypothetical protein
VARLPVVNSDGDAWGTLLNEFLGVAHQADGTIDAADIGNTPAGDITATDVQDALNQLDTNKVDSGDVLSPDGATLEQSGATLRLRQPIATFIEITEMAAPSAPAANNARLFVRDTGGKTELCVMFSDGSIQQIKIQP